MISLQKSNSSALLASSHVSASMRGDRHARQSGLDLIGIDVPFVRPAFDARFEDTYDEIHHVLKDERLK